YDAASHSLKTIAAGDLRDRLGTPLETGQFVSVDPLNRMVCMQFYDGLIKVLELSSSMQTKAQNLRIVCCFLRPGGRGCLCLRLRLRLRLRVRAHFTLTLPLCAFLCACLRSLMCAFAIWPCFLRRRACRVPGGSQSPCSRCLVRTKWATPRACCATRSRPRYVWLQRACALLLVGELTMLTESENTLLRVYTAVQALLQTQVFEGASIDPTARLLVPLPAPRGGVLMLGDNRTTYMPGNASSVADLVSTVHAPMLPHCWSCIDDARVLVGDAAGQLWLLHLLFEHRTCVELQWKRIGSTVQPSTVTHLRDGIVFIGSAHADSALVKVSPEAIIAPAAGRARLGPSAEAGSTSAPMQQLLSFTNLGPILDMCLMDLGLQGQSQVVTASGTNQDGSLRVVRNGIGLQEQAAVELPGITGLWSLRLSSAAAHDKLLVQSYTNETRILSIDEYEMEEARRTARLSCHTASAAAPMHTRTHLCAPALLSACTCRWTICPASTWIAPRCARTPWLMISCCR
ncbi:hypothetical protein EON66_01760, partial [archaeon]